jgi:PAS domain S-box-containing protein
MSYGQISALSPEQFFAAINILPNPVFLISGSGEIVGANLAVESVLEIEQEGLPGRSFSELVSDPSQKVVSYLNSCSRTREKVIGVLSFIAKSGKRINCRVEGGVLQPRSIDKPALIMLVCRPKESTISTFKILNEKIEQLGREITERKKLEATLREQNSLFQAVIEGTTDAVFVKDLESRYLMINSAGARFIGKSVEEIIGKNDMELFPSDIAQQILKHDSEVIHSGQTQTYEEPIIFGKEKLTFLSIKGTYHNDKGETIGIVGIARDISERKRIEEDHAQLLVREQEARLAAEEANRIKDEFIAVVSHELRTPLTAILGWTRLLSSNNLDEASATHAIKTIERNVRTQAQLIEDLLDISRIVNGKLNLDIQPVELDKVMKAAIDSVLLSAESKNIRFKTIINPSAKSVLGDPERLQQIVWNLLSNAIKFTPVGGTIEMRLESRDSFAQIIVSDNGKGISPEFLPYIFERFRQADSSYSRKYSGLGLGLAIVKNLVELHGGTIQAESAGEGKGATFTVRLPLRKISDNQYGETQRHSSGEIKIPTITSELAGLSILVVDDDDDTRELIETILTQSGANVRVASSASEAFRELESWWPNILISDISMPECDGYQFIKILREREPGRRLPAVALTAHARVEDRLKALKAGFQMHVPKPIEPVELITIVASISGLITQ